MKSVGQQLQEARAAKNWTPELAARETKIKVDRIRDLEADDYSHFSSPTYARGFVRTYARALGLDEYKILRQLDSKLPEDDTGTFIPEGGLPYVPEPSTQAMHVSSAPRTGLYVVLALGLGVTLVIAFVLLQAYRAGELPRYFAATGSVDSALTSSAAGSTSAVDSEAPQHALPVDPNDTTHSVRALPVDLNALNSGAGKAVPARGPVVAVTSPSTSLDPGPSATPPAETSSSTPPGPVVAVNAPTPPLDSTPPSTTPEAPRALPVVLPASGEPATGDAVPGAPRALPVDPRDLAGAGNAVPTERAGNETSPVTPVAETSSPRGRRLVLTASRDSFVRVTEMDNPTHQVLYASVLRRGQTLTFGQKRYSLYVGIPSAVDIVLDGVYYGPYSNRESPQTFPLESHQP